MDANLLRERMDTAWSVVMNRFYRKDMKLIFDYVTGNDGQWGFSHLPTVEEINANVPNEAGWGTGMEDCTLNGGSMIEAIVARYAVTGEECLKDIASDIFDGFYKNATVSKDKGFLARSVSPYDNRSHYINSSRDQYTHWMYMGVMLYNSNIATPEQKKKIREVLVSFAQKADRDVIPENQYALLREDGKPGTYCEMYGKMGIHEYHRGPMIYMAAYAVTGDEHWLDTYKKYRDWALEGAEKISYETINRETYCYLFLQMQYSIRLLYDYEQDADYKARYYKLMQTISTIAYKHVKAAEEKMDSLEFKSVVRGWRESPAQLIAMRHGVACYSHKVDAIDEVFRVMRNAAEAIVIGCICPDFKYSAEERDTIERFLYKAQYEKAYCYWPVQCVSAYWMYLLYQK